MKPYARVAGWSLVVGCAGLLITAFCAPIEEGAGLTTLSRLRGPRPAPPEVCVVGMDRDSASALGLSADPSRWPRTVHARMVSRLAASRPAAIVFDVYFDEAREEAEDAAFETALAAASNVILCAFSDLQRLKVDGRHDAMAERLRPPLDRFARHAIAVAPFTLPKVPARVNRFWAFRDNLGYVPSLPVVAFLQFLRVRAPAVWPRAATAALSPRASPPPGRPAAPFPAPASLAETSARVREALLTDRDRGLRARETLRPDASREQRAWLDRLLDVHGGNAHRPLNFYGPAFAIPCLSYRAVAEADPAGDAAVFGGKAVFVGFGDPDAPTQKDGFDTAFTGREGRRLSGTEVAATAFANLVDGSTPRALPMAAQWVLPFVWGGLLGAACRALPTLASAAAALTGGISYLAVAVLVFSQTYLCLPVVVPVFIQPAAAFVGGLVGRNVLAAREQRAMRAAAGLYLPPAVVSRLAESARDLGADRREVHATCLITDAADYTPLSESLPPDELGRFMTRYFQTAFRPVREQGGLVMNLTGDSILAVWLATPPNPAPSPRACAAALDVAVGMRPTAESMADARLPTRIGIHYGPLLLGSMGALDHFEYVPIGDTVNTTARLEGLNKRLRTEVLVSAQALPATAGFHTRRLGAFRFSGKRHAIEVFELLGRDGAVTAQTRRLRELFEEGLARFAAADWNQAARRFRDVLDARHDDGPAAFFLDRCAAFARRAPSAWDGVVEVAKE